jgi:hypothetical protein
MLKENVSNRGPEVAGVPVHEQTIDDGPPRYGPWGRKGDEVIQSHVKHEIQRGTGRKNAPQWWSHDQRSEKHEGRKNNPIQTYYDHNPLATD